MKAIASRPQQHNTLNVYRELPPGCVPFLVEDARLALADESIFDSLTNCTTDGGEHVLTIFLCSLLGEAVDNIVNSGENQ